MECSESTPDSAFDITGTPSTGTTVLAAIMPGRWAAPPAPAMMALRPRPAAAGGPSGLRPQYPGEAAPQPPRPHAGGTALQPAPRAGVHHRRACPQPDEDIPG